MGLTLEHMNRIEQLWDWEGILLCASLDPWVFLYSSAELKGHLNFTVTARIKQRK